MNFRFASVANPNGHQNLSWGSSTLAIPPGTTVAFAIGISNPADAGTLNTGAGTCVLHVDVVNANPISPPFDD